MRASKGGKEARGPPQAANERMDDRNHWRSKERVERMGRIGFRASRPASSCSSTGLTSLCAAILKMSTAIPSEVLCAPTSIMLAPPFDSARESVPSDPGLARRSARGGRIEMREAMELVRSQATSLWHESACSLCAPLWCNTYVSARKQYQRASNTSNTSAQAVQATQKNVWHRFFENACHRFHLGT